MLRFSYGFLCDVAYVSGDGKISVLGIFDNINARHFPVVVPRMVVFAHWKGDEGDYHVRLRFLGPDGKDAIQPLRLEVRIPRGGSKANMMAELNQVNLKMPGTSLFELAVEGQEDKTVISLPVNQVQ
jgi:hypothetical protein